MRVNSPALAAGVGAAAAGGGTGTGASAKGAGAFCTGGANKSSSTRVAGIDTAPKIPVALDASPLADSFGPKESGLSKGVFIPSMHGHRASLE
jgi:hypothetical protein